MTLPPPKVCRRIRRLHAVVGSSNTNEADNALVQLNKLLANHGLTWNDLLTILAESNAGISTSTSAGPHTATAGVEPEINVLDLVVHLLEQYISITAEERLATALWVLHTYVYQQYNITPRLVLLSPVRGCGKTTLLALINQLCAEPFRADNVTAASLYHFLDYKPHSTLLIDEGDNLNLLRNRELRVVFTSGHRRGGGITRFIGRVQIFPTFAPLAIAAIGDLPLPLLHRAVLINMRRHARGETQIQPLDETDPAFPAARQEIQKWALTCSLARDAELPAALHNRAADNWRILLAIADDLEHGEDARSAAVKLCADRTDEDPGVLLLADIKTVFWTSGMDRIPSAALVEALVRLDDGFWNEWRGQNDDRLPRKLTQGELARLLQMFHIRPRTIWPVRRRPGDKSSRGYLRSQFEPVWAAYCPSSDTPTQASKIIQLPRS